MAFYAIKIGKKYFSRWNGETTNDKSKILILDSYEKAKRVMEHWNLLGKGELAEVELNPEVLGK